MVLLWAEAHCHAETPCDHSETFPTQRLEGARRVGVTRETEARVRTTPPPALLPNDKHDLGGPEPGPWATEGQVCPLTLPQVAVATASEDTE